MSAFGLWPLSRGYSTDYLTDFDPRWSDGSDVFPGV
jgi:hypothetical protein